MSAAAAKLAGKLFGKTTKPRTGGRRRKKIKRSPEAVAKKIQREKAVDLGTPAGVDETKVLKGQSQATDQADMVRVGRAEVSKRSKGISKEYKATEKRLEKLQTDLKQAKAFLKGAADDQQKKTLSAKVSKITEQVQIQKNKLTDMKKKNLIKRKGGGSLKPVDAQKNPGLSKLPTPVRNKMGYAQEGGKVGKVIKANTSGDDLVRSCYD